MSLPNSARLLLPALIGGIHAAGAFAAPPALTTSPVVVTATRVEQSGFDLPVSIDSLNQAQIQDGQLQINLSESLARIPGIVAQNRQNYAQDLQISSRGFGARASFGVRGLRIYADGIPATMPDGQGQVSHIDLGSAARIEVLRGPFSSLYGNSSGGVISVFTEDGAPGMRLEPGIALGSYGTQRIGAKLSGERSGLNYVVDASTFRTDGYRDLSAAKRENLNAKLRWAPAADSKLTLIVNSVDMPDIQDPLGLNRADYDANPKQARQAAYDFDVRKSVSQQQLGLNYELKVGPGDTANVMFYRGHRDTIQFQAITVGAQTPAGQAGGVIDLVRDYWGVDLRWTHRGELAGGPVTTSAGINYDMLNETRRGFQNFIGAQLGVLGRIKRDEANEIFNFDQYLQTQWEPTPRWRLMAGLRNSVVKVASKDHFVITGNGDDSGRTDFAAVTGSLGATFRLSDAVNLYAAWGRGFETPTLNELSYRAGGAGLNFGLHPSKSDNLELGVKAALGSDALLSAAIFQIKTRDELVTLSNSGGRAVFQNVAGTKREGAELSADVGLPGNFRAYGAFTALRAVYDQAFLTCTGTPCLVPTTLVNAGNRIPGVPATTAFAELSWRHPSSGFLAALEARAVSRVYVDDRNSDAAEAYTVANLRLGFEQSKGGWKLKEFLRIDNLGDRKYAGSVIVNEGNSNFFEPAPGRNYLLGMTASYGF